MVTGSEFYEAELSPSAPPSICKAERLLQRVYTRRAARGARQVAGLALLVTIGCPRSACVHCLPQRQCPAGSRDPSSTRTEGGQALEHHGNATLTCLAPRSWTGSRGAAGETSKGVPGAGVRVPGPTCQCLCVHATPPRSRFGLVAPMLRRAADRTRTAPSSLSGSTDSTDPGADRPQEAHRAVRRPKAAHGRPVRAPLVCCRHCCAPC